MICMTKRGIIEELLTRHHKFTHRESETIVNVMFDEMAKALASGERIEIRGFGSFGVKKRRAREGRNPKTGVAVKVEAKRIPFFRAGKELKLEVNGAETPTPHARAER
jgi:integration host factor beta subunit